MGKRRKQALERLITKELEKIGWDPDKEPWTDPARRGQQLFVDLGPGLGVFIQTFTREEIEENLGNLEDELEERHPELGPEDVAERLRDARRERTPSTVYITTDDAQEPVEIGDLRDGAAALADVADQELPDDMAIDGWTPEEET